MDPESEHEFTDRVGSWVHHVVEQWLESERARTLRGHDPNRLAVVTRRKLTLGWMAWPTLGEANPESWHHKPFINVWESRESKREVDVAVVLKVRLDGREALVPLFAIELKTGVMLNTDELNKKGEIYARLRETYPSVRTAFIAREYGDHRSLDKLTMNARAFDYVFTSWSDKGEDQPRKLLRDAIHHHLDYRIWYWAF